jgi:zinc and cadmium transporter
MEKGIRWRTCNNEDRCKGHTKPFVIIILTGDTFHNFIDGMVIAASYAVDIKLGITTTIAVMLHEIPHEVGDFGALIHGGLTIKRALIFNFLSSLAAILGAVVSLLIGDVLKGYEVGLLPITAGGFIYLAGSDLLPELYAETGFTKSIIQFICILIGIAMMGLLILIG